MRPTTTFISTAALAIPVLVLAGAVEFRNLATFIERHLLRNLSVALVEHLAELRYRPKNELDKNFSNIIKNARLYMTEPTSGFLIPALWLFSFIYAGIAEVSCFLFLAKLTGGTGLAFGCITSISILIVLLILTPVIQTFSTAWRAASFRTSKRLSPESLQSFFDGISSADRIKLRKQVNEILHFIENPGENSFDIAEPTKRRYALTRHPSRRWPPRKEWISK